MSSFASSQWVRLGLGGLVGWSLACGASPLPPGFAAADAEAFQRKHEAGVSGEDGPLSVTASYYTGPGQTLRLRVADGELVTTEGPGPAVHLEATEHGGRCLEGCGPEPLALPSRLVVTLDRFSLAISRQSGSLRVLVHDPRAAGVTAFTGLAWFPIDARYIVPAKFERESERAEVELATSRGTTKTFVRAGVLHAELLGEPITLVGYQAAIGLHAESALELLVPFTDETTGERSYPVGRYLEVAVSGADVAVLDFNRATNPACAYSEHFNCPIPPAENRLPLAVEAGEQPYPGH